MRLILVVLAALGLATPAAPQEAGTEPAFNLFALDGFGQFEIFDFNAAYTETFGIAVPTDFQLSLPLNDNLELISNGKPQSGFVSFTWAAETGDERRFVENVTVYAADWPKLSGPQERQAEVLALIRDRVFAQATASSGGGTLAGWGGGEVGGLPAVQAAGTYDDPKWGPMLIRIVAVPNPGDGPSYYLINNISLAMVPIVHLDQTRSSLGGQAISSFRYSGG